jgi:hypothetical protein
VQRRHFSKYSTKRCGIHRKMLCASARFRTNSHGQINSILVNEIVLEFVTTNQCLWQSRFKSHGFQRHANVIYELNYSIYSNHVTILTSVGVALIEVLDFLMGYESYLRKRRISVSSRRYKPTGKHPHSLR